MMRSIVKRIYLSAILVAVCGMSQVAVAAPPVFMPDRGHGAYGFMQVQDDRGDFNANVRRDMRDQAKDLRREMRRGQGQQRRFDDLPPEKQQELMQKRDELRQELMNMSPEERADKIRQMRQEMMQRNQNSREEHMQRMDERWEEASPEQRQAFCDLVTQQCADQGGDICDTAEAKCAGQ